MVYTAKERREARIREYLNRHPDASLREVGEYLGVSRQMAHVIIRRMGLQTAGTNRWKRLTDHQVDVLKYVAKGYTDRQIAGFMGCSAKSINNLLQVIYAKLNIHNRKGAVRLAVEKAILPKDTLSTE